MTRDFVCVRRMMLVLPDYCLVQFDLIKFRGNFGEMLETLAEFVH